MTEPSFPPRRPLAAVVALRWLPLAVATTALTLLIHVAVQQAHRASADDPQSQIAEDAAAALAEGASPGQVVGGGVVDMAKSLAPWTMVVDGAGEVVASSVRLDGQTPRMPSGVPAVARRSGGNAVTWQPRRGVRSATVERLVPGGKGWVVIAGRSLREVEIREGQLTTYTLAAWLAALLGSLVATAIAVAVLRS